MPLPLKEMQKNDPVLYYRYVEDGRSELCGVGEAIRVLKTKCNVHPWGEFKLSTGERTDGTRGFIHRPTQEELFNAKQEMKRKAEEKETADEARREAEYDALPEAVKLARKLEFCCSVNNVERTIARMPIELLRAVVAWIEAEKLECD